MLPRLPLVEDVKDFWAFSKAGRKLAELHLNYETVAPSPDVTVTGDDGGQKLHSRKNAFPKERPKRNHSLQQQNNHQQHSCKSI
jgi:predicted helicase